MNIHHYNSLNNYLKNTFGRKLYKLSLNAGFTCPNRDGTIDTRGCIFCSRGGSGDFASSHLLSITEQIEEGRKRVINKLPASSRSNSLPSYIAYFQAFTNTYADIDTLRCVYTEAINHPDIAAISIATRPDCLDDNIISLLDELNKIKPVWVELGLQTIHAKTAEYIRRGYDLSVYDNAVRKLCNINIPQIITHVILGLPGESKDMMLETVKYVVASGSNGIKLQLLHVLRNTDLETDYNNGSFKTLTLEDYIELLCNCIDIIPDNIIVHRLTGDGPKNLLIAPSWSADKKMVLNTISKYIKPL